MSYFKGETKSFSGSPGGVYNIQVHASRNTAGEGGLCVCVSKPILSYCAKCWSQHSAVQTGSMGTLEQCLSWSGSSEQTGELKKKMWRIVNTSVRVCVFVCVHSAVTEAMWKETISPPVLCVCMGVCEQVSSHYFVSNQWQVKHTNTPIYTLSCKQIPTDPLQHNTTHSWWDSRSGSAHTLFSWERGRHTSLQHVWVYALALYGCSNVLTELFIVTGIQSLASQHRGASVWIRSCRKQQLTARGVLKHLRLTRL